MAKTLAELERERRELNKRIAAAKKRAPKKKAQVKKKKKLSIRERYPNFSRGMDQAARATFG